VKESFGKSSGGFEESRQKTRNLIGPYEVVRIVTNSKVGGSSKTSKGVMREAELTTPKVT
jgi:hypothetical protein